MPFNKEKCHIRVEVVPYMGHLLTKNGLTVAQEKVTAIRKMAAPTSKRKCKIHGNGELHREVQKEPNT